MRRSLSILLLLLVLASLVFVGVPIWVIRPFRGQTPGQLTLALHFLEIAPVVTLVLAVVAILVAIALFRAGGWARAWSIAAIVLVCAAAVIARTDYFEFMFHPNLQPHFIAANSAKVGDHDMVLTVRIGQQSRAYPVLEMAYHHIINDTLAGEPIVATY